MTGAQNPLLTTRIELTIVQSPQQKKMNFKPFLPGYWFKCGVSLV